MSRRDSEENSSTNSAGTTPPRRDADADVDHLRLAQLVAANYTPPAPTPLPTQRDSRPAAAPPSSQADILPPEPPAQFDATAVFAPETSARDIDSPRMEMAALPPTPQAADAAPPSYKAMAAPSAKRSPLTCALLAALALFLLVGSVALLLGSMMWFRSATPAHSNTNAPPRRTNVNSVAPSVLPSQVFIPGGTFRMGRDYVSEALLNESPSHAVTVTGFFIDRTEVTNAEYAEFVRATRHPAPSDSSLGEKEMPYWKPWSGANPPAGQEQWPVRNVTVADAQAFAAWRSKRDGVEYRLPTEGEWEYAARNGGATSLYPWGEEFLDDNANLAAELPQPVGSRPKGASREGVLDLIGNVWEWTSSDASVYPGNDRVEITDKGTKTARGGSYQSRVGGSLGVTAMTRIFIKSETRHPTLGFRLVREARNR